MKSILKTYEDIGATFVTPIKKIEKKLQSIKAFVFDWDGVFNNGCKDAGGSSNFSEVDSMGTNLLRYSYFSLHSQPPVTAIISGEKNETSFFFCRREKFHFCFYKVSDKLKALEFICKEKNISPKEITYFFDDVLDLSIASKCGLRMMINQKANPLFAKYCIEKNLCDYLSANAGGAHAVREMTELLIALNGNYSDVIKNRTDFSKHYLSYSEKRRTVETRFLSLEKNKIVEDKM